MRADQGSSALAIVQADLAGVCRTLMNIVAGPLGKAMIDDLRTMIGGTPSEIVWQALYADCLRVVHSALMSDGVIEDREIEALYDIIAGASRQYAAGLDSQYGELAVVDRESARAFLDRYAADRGPFGRGARLRWLGLTLCRRAAELGEREALQRYTKAMTSMSAEARRLAGAPAGDPRRRSPTDEIDELQRILAAEITAIASGVDRRVEAFLAPCNVFSAVQQASSIYENDPFDVTAVHRDARTSFEKLVTRATMRPQPPDLGQMLLVLGDSGAGKTHVLRGFRRHVHDGNLGFVVYAQLQSRSADYPRYLLFHLIESLSRRYSERSGRTGLNEMASGIARLAQPALRERIEALIDDTWKGSGTVHDYVNDRVDELVGLEALSTFDRDLLRVMLYALRPDPKTTSSVYKYLHCEDMNAHDRRWIGDIAPRIWGGHPHKTILELARLAHVTQRVLVIMVDQVDLAGFDSENTDIFRRAIDALYKIVSECTSAIAVVACLSDLYSAARDHLNRPATDRLENAPPIARLQVNRSYAEIEAVVARRLSVLFAEHGTVHRPEQPVYPIPGSELRQLENRRLRDVLEWCHRFQAQCAAAGKIVQAGETPVVENTEREVDLDSIAVAWSEATQATDLEIPDEPEEILAVVAEAAKAYVHEMGLSVATPPLKKGLLRVRMSRGADSAGLAIAVVNQNYHGGAFRGQIESLRKRAKGMVPIAVRTLEFPRGRASDKAMGQLINMGGRGAYLDASTLRALVAFHRFQPPFPPDRVAAWKLRDHPISSLPAVVEIFDFERSRVELRVGRRRQASPPPEVDEGLRPADDTQPQEALHEVPAIEPVDNVSATGPICDTLSGERSPNPTRGIRESRRARSQAPRTDSQSTSSGPSMSVDEARAVGRSTSNGVHSAEPHKHSATAPELVSREKVETSSPLSSAESRSRHPAGTAKQLLIGNGTGFAAEPILLEPVALLRHVAIIDAVGNGRIAAMLNLVEQSVERGLPVVVVDRSGEMSGYARAKWWENTSDPARARRLAERIDVRLFTPGILSGRPLSIAMVPDLSRVQPADQEITIRLAVGAIASSLPPVNDGEALRLALLHDAVGKLARRSSQSGLVELIALIESDGGDATAARDNVEARMRLIDDLARMRNNPEVFTPGAEPLTAATLVGRDSDERVPLAIVHIGFLTDPRRLQSWMSHLFACLSRDLGAKPSKQLHTVFALDGAEQCLPVSAAKGAGTEPLQELLKRAGTKGIGVVLASQAPAELDYLRCTAVDTWFVGKTDEATQNKMKGLFKHRPLGHRNLIRLESARFVMLDEGGSREVERCVPLLRGEQIGTAELRTLAARTRSQVAPRQQGRSDAAGLGAGGGAEREGRENGRPAAEASEVPRP